MQVIENPVIEEWGYVHPEYFDFEGREWISKEEWQAWLAKENLEESIQRLEDEDTPFHEMYFEGNAADLSEWELRQPEGEGWFIGSLFDTEDGPYCIWLRNKE